MDKEVRVMRPTVIVAGQFWHGALEGSFVGAFESLGWQVIRFDLPAATRRYTKAGRIGELFNTFLPIEAWIVKANRELVLAAGEAKPLLTIVGGASNVRAGALAQMRTSWPGMKLALIWPDTLLRLNSNVIAALPLYDLVASYSRAAIDSIRRLGAPQVDWLPFAVDAAVHDADVAIDAAQRRAYECDVSFVGNHRPEREQAVLSLLKAGFSVKVWGHGEWLRDSSDRSAVRRYWQGRPLYGDDFARAVRCSKVSLNPIDPTNYPAANMRVFELLACQAVALNSACPEIEPVFGDGVTTHYYRSSDGLAAVARHLIEHQEASQKVAAAGHRLVMRQHTYVHRVKEMLRTLGLPADEVPTH